MPVSINYFDLFVGAVCLLFLWICRPCFYVK